MGFDSKDLITNNAMSSKVHHTSNHRIIFASNKRKGHLQVPNSRPSDLT